MGKVYVYALPADHGKIASDVKMPEFVKTTKTKDGKVKVLENNLKSWTVLSDTTVVIETTKDYKELEDYKVKEYEEVKE
ncbi:hypothetical protein DRP04_00785 [Archaeoglobales archaeon]|nr:MAG: hypothetical protein DRP04_00785 [Archaeoglobales archaeon]